MRASESACPFCDALVTGASPRMEAPAVRARHAVAFAATLTVAACTPTADKPAPAPTPAPTPSASSTAVVIKPTEPPPAPPPTDVGGPLRPAAARYGMPPFLADDFV